MAKGCGEAGLGDPRLPLSREGDDPSVQTVRPLFGFGKKALHFAAPETGNGFVEEGELCCRKSQLGKGWKRRVFKGRGGEEPSAELFHAIF